MLQCPFDEPVHWHVRLDQRTSCFDVDLQDSREAADVDCVLTPTRCLSCTIGRGMKDPERFAMLGVMLCTCSDGFSRKLVALHTVPSILSVETDDSIISDAGSMFI